MYCSNCGVAVAQGLSYCNYCGAQLSGGKDEARSKSSQPKPEMLVAAMVFVFVFGLGAITMLMVAIKAVLEVNAWVVLAFILSFLIMLSIEGVLVRLLFRRKHDTGEAGDTGQLNGQATRELDAAQGRVLPEHLSSVTEHTTRAFDPIYNERTSK